MVMERFSRSEKWRYEKEKIWLECYEMYRGISKGPEDGIEHDIFVPESFTIVETLTPRLITDYFKEIQKILRVKAREIQDVPAATLFNGIIPYQSDKMAFPRSLIPFVKQMLIYGTAVGKAYWRLDEREKTITQKQTFSFGTQTIDIMVPDTQRYTFFDGPMFEPIDIFDFFPEPNAISLEDAKWVIHRKFVSMEQLQDMAALGVHENLDKIGETDDRELPDLQKEITKIEGITETRIEGTYELLEYWEDERVIVVIDRKHIIRDEENPFAFGEKPFIIANFIHIPFHIFGIGALEPITDLQYELNEIRSQRADYIKRTLNPMWLAQRGFVEDINELKSKAGGIIICTDINLLKPLPIDGNLPFNSMAEDGIKNEIQNATGVTDYIKGGNTPKATATEVQLKSSQSSTRFDFTILEMAYNTIRKIWRFIIELDQQLLDKPLMLRIAGPYGGADQYQQVNPWEISGEFDLEIQVDQQGQNQEIERQQYLMFYQLASQDPTANKPALLLRLAEKLNIPNPQELILSPEQQQQQAMMQQPQAGMPGAVQGGMPSSVPENPPELAGMLGALQPQ